MVGLFTSARPITCYCRTVGVYPSVSMRRRTGAGNACYELRRQLAFQLLADRRRVIVLASDRHGEAASAAYDVLRIIGGKSVVIVGDRQSVDGDAHADGPQTGLIE